MSLETIAVLKKLRDDAHRLYAKQGLTVQSYGWLLGWIQNELDDQEADLDKIADALATVNKTNGKPYKHNTNRVEKRQEINEDEDLDMSYLKE